MKPILETEVTGFIGGIEVGLDDHVEDCMSERHLQGII